MNRLIIHLVKNDIILTSIASLLSFIILGLVHWIALRKVPIKKAFKNIVGDDNDDSSTPDLPVKSSAVLFSMLGLYACFALTMTVTTMITLIDIFTQVADSSHDLGVSWVYTAVFSLVLAGGLGFYYLESSDTETNKIQSAREDVESVSQDQNKTKEYSTASQNR